MNVDEFLKSAQAARRTKISKFDAEIRALRAQGISGQGIVNFLKLHDVQVTKSAVNQYLVRHPVRYSVRRGGSVPTGRDGDAVRNARGSPDVTDNEHQPPTSAPGLSTAGGDNSTAVVNAGASQPRASDHPRNPVTPSDISDSTPTAGQRHSNEVSGARRSDVSEPTSRPATSQGSSIAPRSHSPRDPRPNAASNGDAFGSRPDSDDPYDGHDTNRPSPLKRYDPNDPKNIAAVASYKQRLRDGQIRTGETTNTNLDRSTDET